MFELLRVSISFVSRDWFQDIVLWTLEAFWLGYSLIILCIVYPPMALIRVTKLKVEGFFMALYTHYSILESVTTIYNNILKCCCALIIKVLLRLSLLIRLFSSVTKFIAEHDRVPHVLRNDVGWGWGGAMWCNDQRRLCNIISIIVRLLRRLSWIWERLMLGQVS